MVKGSWVGYPLPVSFFLFSSVLRSALPPLLSHQLTGMGLGGSLLAPQFLFFSSLVSLVFPSFNSSISFAYIHLISFPVVYYCLFSKSLNLISQPRVNLFFKPPPSSYSSHLIRFIIFSSLFLLKSSYLKIYCTFLHSLAFITR